MLNDSAILKGIEKIAPFAIWVYDIPQQKMIYASPPPDSKFDYYTLEELQALSTNIIEAKIHPEDRAKMYEEQEAFKTLKEGEFLRIQFRFQTKGGKYVHFENKSMVFKRSDDGSVLQVIGVSTEIERFVRLAEEEQILQTHKNQIHHTSRITAIGEMVSGIAHETNNPLSVIQARAYQILQKIQEDRDLKSVHRFTESILQNADRIAKIIRSLKTFSYQGSGQPFQKALVSDLIQNSLALTEGRFAKHQIPIKVSRFKDQIRITCRPVEIEQVFVNLLNNSFDAIMEYRSPNSHQETSDFVSVSVAHGEADVEFRFQNTGPKIKPEYVEKLMSPFFTTKPMGQGTGLGLSVSASIIRDHEGEIYYDPSEALTTFVVKLPLCLEQGKQLRNPIS